MNTALEYSTRVVQEGGRRCKKSTLNDLVHLTPLRIPLMNPSYVEETTGKRKNSVMRTIKFGRKEEEEKERRERKAKTRRKGQKERKGKSS
jgi:hypothetical protein